MVRFTIRDVLWLMVVVGLGVGWLADHRNMLRREQSMEDARLFMIGDLNAKLPPRERRPFTPAEIARLEEIAADENRSQRPSTDNRP